MMQWSFQRRAAPFPTYASGARFADRAKLRLPAISLNKSGVTRRLCRHNGLRRRWSGPLRSEGVRSLQRHARSQVHLQGMTGSLRRRGRRFALTAG